MYQKRHDVMFFMPNDILIDNYSHCHNIFRKFTPSKADMNAVGAVHTKIHPTTGYIFTNTKLVITVLI